MPYGLTELREPYNPPIWREIPDIPGYEISSDGQVRNARIQRVLKHVNDGRPNPNVAITGHGNRSVRKLLSLTYPELYEQDLRVGQPKVRFEFVLESGESLVLEYRNLKDSQVQNFIAFTVSQFANFS